MDNFGQVLTSLNSFDKFDRPYCVYTNVLFHTISQNIVASHCKMGGNDTTATKQIPIRAQETSHLNKRFCHLMLCSLKPGIAMSMH